MDSEDYADSVHDSDDEGSFNNTICQEKNYTVLSEEDIRNREKEAISRVCSVLPIPRVWASILLRHYNWSASSVHENWFSDEEKVRMTAGLLKKPIVDYPDCETCKICYEDFNSRRSEKCASCGHRFCRSCWKSYIRTSINDGPGCLVLRCPEPGCIASVEHTMIENLVYKHDMEKYSMYLIRSYVEASKNIKWCPAPGCQYAVELEIGTENKEIFCDCAYGFCWNCNEDAHRPVDCTTVKRWVSKSTAESQNRVWILANSKPCPKCSRSIEKNQGCMHMTCTPPCNYQFCWMCLRAWSNHDHKTGGFYACNHYERARKEGIYDEAEKTRHDAKHALERYNHYYERWVANESSRKKAIADFHEMRNLHIGKLRQKQTLSVEFILEAWQQIIECRRVLKWSYAYGYFIPEHECQKLDLFEYLQGEAERHLESLHQCAEQEIQVHLDSEGWSEGFIDFKTKLSRLTAASRIYFENLVQALEKGLNDADMGGSNKRKRRIDDRVSSKSSRARYGQEELLKSWNCEHCTYWNDDSSGACEMCGNQSVHSKSWYCEKCSYLNGRFSTRCGMCELPREDSVSELH